MGRLHRQRGHRQQRQEDQAGLPQSRPGGQQVADAQLAPREQRDWKHRIGSPALDGHQRHPAQHGDQQRAPHQRRGQRRPEGRGVNTDQTEGQGEQCATQQHHAEAVETARIRQPVAGQHPPGQHDHYRRDRQVDHEQPLPAGQQQHAAQDRPDHESDAEYRSDQAQGASASVRREGVADDGAGHGEDAAGTESLNGSTGQQQSEAADTRRGDHHHRAEREQGDVGDVDRSTPEVVRQLGHQGSTDQIRQHVGAEDPGRGASIQVELCLDRR